MFKKLLLIALCLPAFSMAMEIPKRMFADIDELQELCLTRLVESTVFNADSTRIITETNGLIATWELQNNVCVVTKVLPIDPSLPCVKHTGAPLSQDQYLNLLKIFCDETIKFSFSSNS